MLGGELRNRQKATNAFILDEKTATVGVVRGDLDGFRLVELGNNLVPTLVLDRFAERK